jgi:hypothetical protein
MSDNDDAYYDAVMAAIFEASQKDPEGRPIVDTRAALSALIDIVAEFILGVPLENQEAELAYFASELVVAVNALRADGHGPKGIIVTGLQ